MKTSRRWWVLAAFTLAACGGRVEIVSDVPGETGKDGRDGTAGPTGQAGVTGATGDEGVQGQDGADGEDGEGFDVSRLYTKRGVMELWSSGAMVVSCNVGDVLISGGCRMTGVARDGWLTVSEPQEIVDTAGNPTSSPPNAWVCAGWKVEMPSTGNVGPQIVTGTAVCYKAAGL